MTMKKLIKKKKKYIHFAESPNCTTTRNLKHHVQFIYMTIKTDTRLIKVLYRTRLKQYLHNT